MEYTIKKLSEIANVSTRTLRYYDEIGLLKPCRINSSGYRIYGEKEVDKLQQILLYKNMDMKLEDIQKILCRKDFNINKSLKEHLNELLSRKDEIERLILTVKKTIDYNKGAVKMKDREKFEGFKKEKLAENERKYGKEIREKYGNDVVEKSNKKFMNLSEEDFKRMQETETDMFKSLEVVLKNGDLNCTDAKNVYERHKEWLSFSWPSYSKEAHAGLAQMYVDDERFSKYYDDKLGKNSAITLRDIILNYTK